MAPPIQDESKQPDWDGKARARSPRNLDPATYARLKAEVNAPYRGFRKFIYGAIAGSGGIGGVVFLAQILAGRNLDTALPNFAVQAGVVGLMVLLFYLENRVEKRRSQKNDQV